MSLLNKINVLKSFDYDHIVKHGMGYLGQDNISGVFSTFTHSWLTCGPKLVIINHSDGAIQCSWTFGEHSNEEVDITCAIELPLEGCSIPLLLLAVSSENTSQISFFNPNTRKILRTIELNYPVRTLCIIEDGLHEVNPINDALTHTQGLFAAGCADGSLLLLDLCRSILLKALSGDFRCTSSEENPAEINVLEVRSVTVSSIQQKLKECNTNKTNLALLLTEEREGITALCYSFESAVLYFGTSSGSFVLWNMSCLNVIFRSQSVSRAVVSLSMLEPCDDPRHNLFLWVCYENNPCVLMYCITFTSKYCVEGYGVFYQGFEGVAPAFKLKLGLEDNVIVNRTIASQAIAKPISKNFAKSFSIPEGDCPQLRLFVTAYEVLLKGQTSSRAVIFDLNQWYKEQMPEEGMSSCLDNVYLDGSSLSHFMIEPGSLMHYQWVRPLEQHFHPSSLDFKMWCIEEEGIRCLEKLGLQSQWLRNMSVVGPSALLSPSQVFHGALSAGLLPTFIDPPDPEYSSIEEERSYVLTVCLENRATSVIEHCAQEWSTGSHPVTGCTLPFLIDWLWELHGTYKSHGNRMCIPLFDQSGLRFDFSERRALQHCKSLLCTVQSVYANIINKYSTYVLVEGIEQKLSAMSLVKFYFDCCLKLISAHLLPEPNEAGRPSNSLPYKYEDTYTFVALKRKEGPFLGDSLIGKTGGESQWEEEGGAGRYPPPSIQSVLRYCLHPAPSLWKKHSLILYLYMDIINYHTPLRDQAGIEKVKNFQYLLRISDVQYKIVSGFWYLDHSLFEEGISLLLDPRVLSMDLTDDQHRSILSLLLIQNQEKLGLQYLRLKAPALHQPNDISMELNLLLSNRLINEAFMFQRKHVELREDLLLQFFQGCIDKKLLGPLFGLHLDAKEESVLLRFLKTCDLKEKGDLQVLLLLSRAKYTEALSLNDRLNSKLNIPKSRLEPGTRDMIVKGITGSMNTISRDIASEMRQYRPPPPGTRPAPLSSLIKVKREPDGPVCQTDSHILLSAAAKSARHLSEFISSEGGKRKARSYDDDGMDIDIDSPPRKKIGTSWNVDNGVLRHLTGGIGMITPFKSKNNKEREVMELVGTPLVKKHGKRISPISRPSPSILKSKTPEKGGFIDEQGETPRKTLRFNLPSTESRVTGRKSLHNKSYVPSIQSNLHNDSDIVKVSTDVFESVRDSLKSARNTKLRDDGGVDWTGISESTKPVVLFSQGVGKKPTPIRSNPKLSYLDITISSAEKKYLESPSREAELSSTTEAIFNITMPKRLFAADVIEADVESEIDDLKEKCQNSFMERYKKVRNKHLGNDSPLKQVIETNAIKLHDTDLENMDTQECSRNETISAEEVVVNIDQGSIIKKSKENINVFEKVFEVDAFKLNVADIEDNYAQKSSTNETVSAELVLKNIDDKYKPEIARDNIVGIVNQEGSTEKNNTKDLLTVDPGLHEHTPNTDNNKNNSENIFIYNEKMVENITQTCSNKTENESKLEVVETKESMKLKHSNEEIYTKGEKEDFTNFDDDSEKEYFGTLSIGHSSNLKLGTVFSMDPDNDIEDLWASENKLHVEETVEISSEDSSDQVVEQENKQRNIDLEEEQDELEEDESEEHSEEEEKNKKMYEDEDTYESDDSTTEDEEEEEEENSDIESTPHESNCSDQSSLAVSDNWDLLDEFTIAKHNSIRTKITKDETGSISNSVISLDSDTSDEVEKESDKSKQVKQELFDSQTSPSVSNSFEGEEYSESNNQERNLEEDQDYELKISSIVSLPQSATTDVVFADEATKKRDSNSSEANTYRGSQDKNIEINAVENKESPLKATGPNKEIHLKLSDELKTKQEVKALHKSNYLESIDNELRVERNTEIQKEIHGNLTKGESCEISMVNKDDIKLECLKTDNYTKAFRNKLSSMSSDDKDKEEAIVADIYGVRNSEILETDDPDSNNIKAAFKFDAESKSKVEMENKDQIKFEEQISNTPEIVNSCSSESMDMKVGTDRHQEQLENQEIEVIQFNSNNFETAEVNEILTSSVKKQEQIIIGGSESYSTLEVGPKEDNQLEKEEIQSCKMIVTSNTEMKPSSDSTSKDESIKEKELIHKTSSSSNEDSESALKQSKGNEKCEPILKESTDFEMESDTAEVVNNASTEQTISKINEEKCSVSVFESTSKNNSKSEGFSDISTNLILKNNPTTALNNERDCDTPKCNLNPRTKLDNEPVEVTIEQNKEMAKNVATKLEKSVSNISMHLTTDPVPKVCYQKDNDSDISKCSVDPSISEFIVATERPMCFIKDHQTSITTLEKANLQNLSSLNVASAEIAEDKTVSVSTSTDCAASRQTLESETSESNKLTLNSIIASTTSLDSNTVVKCISETEIPLKELTKNENKTLDLRMLDSSKANEANKSIKVSELQMLQNERILMESKPNANVGDSSAQNEEGVIENQIEIDSKLRADKTRQTDLSGSVSNDNSCTENRQQGCTELSNILVESENKLKLDCSSKSANVESTSPNQKDICDLQVGDKEVYDKSNLKADAEIENNMTEFPSIAQNLTLRGESRDIKKLVSNSEEFSDCRSNIVVAPETNSPRIEKELAGQVKSPAKDHDLGQMVEVTPSPRKSDAKNTSSCSNMIDVLGKSFYFGRDGNNDSYIRASKATFQVGNLGISPYEDESVNESVNPMETAMIESADESAVIDEDTDPRNTGMLDVDLSLHLSEDEAVRDEDKPKMVDVGTVTDICEMTKKLRRSSRNVDSPYSSEKRIQESRLNKQAELSSALKSNIKTQKSLKQTFSTQTSDSLINIKFDECASEIISSKPILTRTTSISAQTLDFPEDLKVGESSKNSSEIPIVSGRRHRRSSSSNSQAADFKHTQQLNEGETSEKRQLKKVSQQEPDLKGILKNKNEVRSQNLEHAKDLRVQHSSEMESDAEAIKRSRAVKSGNKRSLEEDRDVRTNPYDIVDERMRSNICSRVSVSHETEKNIHERRKSRKSSVSSQSSDVAKDLRTRLEDFSDDAKISRRHDNKDQLQGILKKPKSLSTKDSEGYTEPSMQTRYSDLPQKRQSRRSSIASASDCEKEYKDYKEDSKQKQNSELTDLPKKRHSRRSSLGSTTDCDTETEGHKQKRNSELNDLPKKRSSRRSSLASITECDSGTESNKQDSKQKMLSDLTDLPKKRPSRRSSLSSITDCDTGTEDSKQKRHSELTDLPKKRSSRRSSLASITECDTETRDYKPDSNQRRHSELTDLPQRRLSRRNSLASIAESDTESIKHDSKQKRHSELIDLPQKRHSRRSSCSSISECDTEAVENKKAVKLRGILKNAKGRSSITSEKSSELMKRLEEDFPESRKRSRRYSEEPELHSILKKTEIHNLRTKKRNINSEKAYELQSRFEEHYKQRDRKATLETENNSRTQRQSVESVESDHSRRSVRRHSYTSDTSNDLRGSTEDLSDRKKLSRKSLLLNRYKEDYMHEDKKTGNRSSTSPDNDFSYQPIDDLETKKKSDGSKHPGKEKSTLSKGSSSRLRRTSEDLSFLRDSKDNEISSPEISPGGSRKRKLPLENKLLGSSKNTSKIDPPLDSRKRHSIAALPIKKSTRLHRPPLDDIKEEDEETPKKKIKSLDDLDVEKSNKTKLNKKKELKQFRELVVAESESDLESSPPVWSAEGYEKERRLTRTQKNVLLKNQHLTEVATPSPSTPRKQSRRKSITESPPCTPTRSSLRLQKKPPSESD